MLLASAQGDLVYRTGQIVNVPIGPGTLGRVTDALGQPIDGKGPLTNVRSSLVEVKAPGEWRRRKGCISFERSRRKGCRI